MPSDNGPEKYNQDRTDEIMREAACKAAQYGIKLIDDANADKMIVNFDSHLDAVGAFIQGCGAAMTFDNDKDTGPPDFDTD